MNKWLKLVAIIFAVTLSNSAFAKKIKSGVECEVFGNKTFSVSFTVKGGSSTYQSVYFQHNGAHPDEVAWYTQQLRSDSSNKHYHFNEQSLQKDRTYEVEIFHNSSNNLSKYYRRVKDQTDWLLVGTMNKDMKNGKLSVQTEGGDISNVRCDSDATEPDVSWLVPDNVCESFPEPIQGWKGDKSTLKVTNSGVRVLGWSDEYRKDNTIYDINDLFYYQEGMNPPSQKQYIQMGFDYASQNDSRDRLYKNPICADDTGCDIGDKTSLAKLNARKAQQPDLLNVNFSATKELTISTDKNEPYYYGEVCGPNSMWCGFTETKQHVTILLKEDLKKLKLRDINASKPVELKLEGQRKIRNVDYGAAGNFSIYIADNSELTSKTFKTTGSRPKFIFGSNVVWNVVGTDQPPRSYFNTNADFALEDAYFDYRTEQEELTLPVIYGPQASFHFKTATGQLFKGFILAKSVLLDTNEQIYGSITSLWLEMIGSTKVSKPDYSCSSTGPYEDNYSLELTPQSAISLVCEDLSSTLSVMSDGVLATDFTGSIKVTIDGEPKVYPVNNGSFSKELEISSGGVSKTVSITAYIEGDESTKVSGSYQFVPYNLKIDDQYVIANKSVKVSAIAQACNDEEVIDLGYDGKPDVSPQWVRPASGAVGDLTYVPIFAGGKSSDDLTLEDSGELLVTLTDDNFTCSGDDCPIEGDGDTKTLKGQFTVYSRPWTFAICSTDNTKLDDATGDSNSGDGFIAAGETFDAKVLPLRYTDSGSISGEVESTSFLCGQDVTSNFFLGDSSDNTVVISSSVETPTQSDDLVFSSEISRKNSDNEYTFTDLSWEDVGSLKLMAATSDNSSCAPDGTLQTWYECTQMGYREVGRFYPAWLSLVSNNWDYATGLDDFMYMGQPIAYDFVVEAQNKSGNPTENYSAFASSLKAEIELFAVDRNSTHPVNQDISSRIKNLGYFEWKNGSADGWWSKAEIKPNYKTFLFQKKGNGSTVADGPFDDGFGLVITSSADNVDFKADENCDDTDSLTECHDIQLDSGLGKLFENQPDIRYGRMAMDDVGGTSVSTINIPLRTEYWNGSRFITNTDDSASDYSSDEDYVCYQKVWSEASGSDGSLNGVTKTVDSGVSDELYANPYSEDDSSSIRQQLRFWLRMDDTSTTSPQTLETDGVTCGSSYMSQPWLQYNWRGKGDEDPSSVVTFGIHRGNDRVIYRGEPGLTAQ